MIDLTGRVMMRQLVRQLSIPWEDVDVALATVRPVQVANTRYYDAREATAALEAYYLRRAGENRQRYEKCGAKIYRTREETCLARLDRVREWRDRLEGAERV